MTVFFLHILYLFSIIPPSRSVSVASRIPHVPGCFKYAENAVEYKYIILQLLEVEVYS